MFVATWLSLWDAPSLWIWEAVEVVGALVVTIGVVGEYIASFTKIPKGRSRKKRWEKRSTLILIAGLAIELLGLVTTMALSNIEIQRLIANNLELQSKLLPRRINATQMADFKFLTERIEKIPIKVVTVSAREPMNFAHDIREMLTFAGFKTNSDTTVEDLNIYAGNILNKVGNTNGNGYIYFINDKAEGYIETNRFKIEVANGIERRIISVTNESTVLPAISECLIKCGVPCIQMGMPKMVQPGHWIIFIEEK